MTDFFSPIAKREILDNCLNLVSKIAHGISRLDLEAQQGFEEAMSAGGQLNVTVRLTPGFGMAGTIGLSISSPFAEGGSVREIFHQSVSTTSEGEENVG